MIGIIGAMDVELTLIKAQVENGKEEVRGIRTFYTGTIKGKEVVIVLAGIGKVNAGITTSLLAEYYDISCIINIGVAGGQNGVTHGDVVVSSEVLYHDADVSRFGKYVRGQIPGLDPTFKADENLINKTKEILEPLREGTTKEKIAVHIGKARNLISSRKLILEQVWDKFAIKLRKDLNTNNLNLI